MLIRILIGYLCITGFASVFVYMACIAAARADRIRERTQWETYATDSEQTHGFYPQKTQKSIYTRAILSSMSE